MAIFGAGDQSWLEYIILYLYQSIVLVSLAVLGFVFFLFRTRAPLKEEEEHVELETVANASKASAEDSGKRKHRLANGAVSGVMENSMSDEDLLRTIIDGINMADVVSAEDDLENGHLTQQQAFVSNGTRRRQVSEHCREEEEEDESVEVAPRRRQIIREVTVRKIILPPDSHYSDVQKFAARKIIGEVITNQQKREGDVGGEFDAAIRNIREASKRLDGDDISPRSNASR